MNKTELMNMSIVLVEPTSKERMTPDYIRGNTLEPYAIECLGAYLVANEYKNVRLLQQYDLSDAELIQEIIKNKPLIVGFSVRSFNYDNAVKIASEIKRQLPEACIVFGGYHPTLNIEETLQNDFVDFVVFGEGEVTFHELTSYILSGGKKITEIAGIAFRENSRIIKNPTRHRIANLDSLPFPLREKRFLERSKQWNLSYPPPSQQRAVAQISYSRGCQFRCNFCVSPQLWCKDTDATLSGPITYRSVSNVIEEIKLLKEKYGVNFIYFNDLTFNASEERVGELCQALIDSGLHNPTLESDINSDETNNIHWFCLAKVGISAKLAELMAKAGCSKIGFGIESFYKQGQTEMKKPYRGVDDIEETLENTDKVGIINRAFIILGWPHETQESIDATVNGLLSTKVDQIRVTYYTPFPGTELFAEFKKRGVLIESDYSKYDGNSPTVQCENLTIEELREARTRMIESFYTSPIYIQRCKDKIKRFPRLDESYKCFVNEIFELSKGRINLKGVL